MATTIDRLSLPSPEPLVPPENATTRELMIVPGWAEALTVTPTEYAGVEAPAPRLPSSQSIVYGSGREHPDGGSPTVQLASKERTSEKGACAVAAEFVAENVIVTLPPGGALVGVTDSLTPIATSRTAADEAPANASMAATITS